VASRPKRERLDKILVDRELASSRERARALILAGQVEVGGFTVDKAGALIDPGVEVRLREPDLAYVSRGALKLEPALERFAIDPTGAVAIDIGASTGGFTDLLLRRGAARVYAVDVGYGQLAWSLRSDARVVVLERENVRHLDPARVPEPCDLAVVDVSFISLTLVLPKIAELLRPPPGKPIICLVKPQFEVGKGNVGKGGVVRDPGLRAGALDRVRDFAAASGFDVGDAIDSPIAGPAGNLEFLLLLRTRSDSLSR
jgi:23S rRNA (cytidine1920-2'-O)/16S rRNA (cytidine1409-2'-O)-methyltransferase